VVGRRSKQQIGLFEPKRATRSATRGPDALQPHIAREAHHRDHPVHVTMRRVPTGPSFRAQRVCAAIRGVIAGAKPNGVRVLHYSVQENHLHLMVEGRDSADLSNQMRTLFSRIAFAVNAIARRHGRLFRDRHHRHELTTPSEVRNALVYILFNDRKHHAVHGSAVPPPPSLDPCSSAWWFEAWAPSDRPPERNLRDGPEAPTSKPLTWLARWGWHRGDEKKLLRFSETPCSSRAPSRAR
jgi:putative transposase